VRCTKLNILPSYSDSSLVLIFPSSPHPVLWNSIQFRVYVLCVCTVGAHPYLGRLSDGGGILCGPTSFHRLHTICRLEASSTRIGLSVRRNRLAIHQSAAKLAAVSIALFSHSSVGLPLSISLSLSASLWLSFAAAVHSPLQRPLYGIPFSLISCSRPAAQLSF